jgi:predicted hotdog family 3-hydroxylacyl-ACP dehydratase
MQRLFWQENDMAFPDVRSLIPHTGSMVLLERIIAADQEGLCAEVRIRAESLFCSANGVGGWVGLEYMAQTIAAYAGYRALLRGEPIKLGFLLGTRRYECSRATFAVGSLLRVHVKRLLQSENGLGSFECHIEDQEGMVASATVTVFQPDDASDFLKGVRDE